jgi:hypothetical protein
MTKVKAANLSPHAEQSQENSKDSTAQTSCSFVVVSSHLTTVGHGPSLHWLHLSFAPKIE